MRKKKSVKCEVNGGRSTVPAHLQISEIEDAVFGNVEFGTSVVNNFCRSYFVSENLSKIIERAEKIVVESRSVSLFCDGEVQNIFEKN